MLLRNLWLLRFPFIFTQFLFKFKYAIIYYTEWMHLSTSLHYFIHSIGVPSFIHSRYWSNNLWLGDVSSMSSSFPLEAVIYDNPMWKNGTKLIVVVNQHLEECFTTLTKMTLWRNNWFYLTILDFRSLLWGKSQYREWDGWSHCMHIQ